MNLSDFDFHLPEHLIAQSPPERRGSSRLLVLPRTQGPVAHRAFSDLPALLGPRDLLVVNDAKVIPARLLGHKRETGGKVELLLVRPLGRAGAADVLASAADESPWLCLGQASKGLRPGAQLVFEAGLEAEVRESLGGGEYAVAFRASGSTPLSTLLERAGRLPLPPYITRAPTAADEERYQTVYARSAGSVAAPTAGLHFTPELMTELEARGVRRATVTLDVGPGTFLPVRTENLDAHVMHEERFALPAETVAAIEETRRTGGRVVAVGTTVVRTLEAATDPESGRLRPGPGETALFIRPGYAFRQVDALVTNFHLPRSTLVMLVGAFTGRERLLEAYRQAVDAGYRFFSYGDAMFIADEVLS